MHDFQVVPKCIHATGMSSGGILNVSVRYRYSLSVVDGDGEDCDGRAGHGVGAHQCTDVGKYPLL